MINDEIFDAYVNQIVKGAREADESDARSLVDGLLSEFKEKAYLEGRHALMDILRMTIDRHDDRTNYGRKPPPPPT